MAQENISSELENLLVTRNFDVDVKDKDGNDSTPDQAKTFSFDYVASSGNNYGRMVLVLQDGNTLLIMFGDNLGRSIEDPTDRQEFYDFQQQLHSFANRNFYKPSTMDISKIKHVMRGMAAIKESLFESYYGNRRVSYMGAPTEARLVINHAKLLGEHDARHRYIESIFIETSEGERYKLQYKNLAGAKAMLEHVRQGGRPYDVRGTHITEMVNEIAVLSRFRRANSNRVLEGITAELVTEAETYYNQLRETVRRLSLTAGYGAYFESWEPTEIALHEELVDSIKTMFIEQTLDARIEAALPVLARLKQNTMKEAEIFENWAQHLVEGTWALPDTPEKWEKLQQLMSEPLMVGASAMNATEQLDDIVGDDVLFDRLQELAKEDPNANCWDDTEVQARLQQLGVAMNTTPAAETEPTAPTAPQAVAEHKINEIGPAIASVASRLGPLAARALPASAQRTLSNFVRPATQQATPAQIVRGNLPSMSQVKPPTGPGSATVPSAPGSASRVEPSLNPKTSYAPDYSSYMRPFQSNAPASTAATAAKPTPAASSSTLGNLGQKITTGVGALAAGLGLPYALTPGGEKKATSTAPAAPAAPTPAAPTPGGEKKATSTAPAAPAAPTPAAPTPAAPKTAPTPAAPKTAPTPAAPKTAPTPAAPKTAPTPAAPKTAPAASAPATDTTGGGFKGGGFGSIGTSGQTATPIATGTGPGSAAELAAKLGQQYSTDQSSYTSSAKPSVPAYGQTDDQRKPPTEFNFAGDKVPTDTGIEKTDEGDNLNSFEEGVDDPMNYNAAITGSYYESRSDDALLARIKSLAMLK
jgi:hypothetical protein